MRCGLRCRAVLSGLVLATAGSATVGAAHRLTPADPRPPDASAGLAPAVAAALAPPEYHLAPDAGGFAAANPAQDLAVGFTQAGVRVTAGAGGRLDLSVSALGRQGALEAPPQPELVADGARVEYRRGTVTEWYVNDPRGVEQGFTLDAAPAGHPSFPLVVALTADGLRPVLDSTSASIRFEGQGTTVHYGGLHAYDATGRSLPSRLGLSAGTVTLTVDDAGAAYPVTIDPLIATHQAQLLAPDAAAGDLLGRSVAVSGDTAVVGARNDDGGAGSAHVFVRTGTTWTHQAKLVAPDAEVQDLFGRSVAVSGNTIIVGADGDNLPGLLGNAGSAHVFVRSGSSWTHQAQLRAPDAAAGDQFGFSVSVSGDTALVGAYLDDTPAGTNGGSAYVFVRSGTDWTHQAQLLPAESNTDEDRFGTSVALSGDTAVVGSPQHSGYGGATAGAAYVFVRSGTTWSSSTLLLPPYGTIVTERNNDQFGNSVAIWGDTAVVGAAFDNTSGGGDAGSAHVFLRTGASWAYQAELLAGDGTTSDQFGFSVAVSGDTAVVGANLDDNVGGTDAGGAYVFVRTGTTWAQQTKLLPPAGGATDWFGASVAVSGVTAVVGATFDDTAAGADAGSAHAFRLNRQSLLGTVVGSTAWSLRNTLSNGGADTTFSYGTKPLVPLVGDWDGDGIDTPGTYESGTFKLRNVNAGAATIGFRDVSFTFGDPRGFPVAGDFDGDGRDDVAVYRNGTWQVRYADDGATSTLTFGAGAWPSTVPVAGDWDGDGIDGIGTFVLATGTWNLRQTAAAVAPPVASFVFWAGSGSYPVVGDWDTDGDDTVAVKNGATWSLNNQNDASGADSTITFGTGASNELPIVWAH